MLKQFPAYLVVNCTQINLGVRVRKQRNTFHARDVQRSLRIKKDFQSTNPKKNSYIRKTKSELLKKR